MKKLASYVFIVLVIGLSSCVESSKKYDALVAERDSLKLIAETVHMDFESSLQTINEIEDALQAIRQAENIIMMESQEGSSNYALSQIEAIDHTIQQNKAKIEELEKQLGEEGLKSIQLTATITRLKNELNEKDTYIANLRTELDESKAQVIHLSGKIDDLNKDVKHLNENIDSLSAQNAEQLALLQQHEAELNTVYYLAAPMETLKSYNLVTKGGLFKKENLTLEFDKSLLIAADKRDLRRIPLNTRKANIMTTHPKNSYQLTKDDDNMCSLEIVDPEAFWTISNYLIISIK